MALTYVLVSKQTSSPLVGSKIMLPAQQTFANTMDDSQTLGAKDYLAPARLPGYKYETTPYQGVYDKTWTQGGYPSQSCWGCRFASDVVSRLTFHSVLDAGTGNGNMVRLMREHGKSAWGIE